MRESFFIDTYRVNFVYQEMVLQGNIAYLWKKKIITILEHLQIFVRKTTSESQRCCNVNAKSENRRQKHNIVTTLWQSYLTSQPKYNQNLTLLQRRVPAEEESASFINKEGIAEKKTGKRLDILTAVTKRINYI